MKLEFDPQADAAYLELTDAEVQQSREIQSGIIVDYDAEEQVVGIEILYVSKRAPIAIKKSSLVINQEIIVAYQHRYLDGSPLDLPVGKVVCIGRNYLDHIRELNNVVPETPILFMKPTTALTALDEPIRLPVGRGECHHEVELAVLVGQELRHADAITARQAVAGYGVALDLTLRDLQNELKKKGHPWETAKAFDGSCPLSPFLKPDALPEPQATDVRLQVNGAVRQQGNTGLMMVGIFELMAYISTHFTLQPGDVVLTGTPAGVAPLASGDALVLSLAGHDFTARVA